MEHPTISKLKLQAKQVQVSIEDFNNTLHWSIENINTMWKTIESESCNATIDPWLDYNNIVDTFSNGATESINGLIWC